MDNHLKIRAQNRKNYDLDTLKIIMDVYYISYQGKIKVQIDNTLQFAHVSKKLNVSPATHCNLHIVDPCKYD